MAVKPLMVVGAIGLAALAGQVLAACSQRVAPALSPSSTCADWNNADQNVQARYVRAQEQAGVQGLNQYSGYATGEISRYCSDDPDASLGAVTQRVAAPGAQEQQQAEENQRQQAARESQEAEAAKKEQDLIEIETGYCDGILGTLIPGTYSHKDDVCISKKSQDPSCRDANGYNLSIHYNSDGTLVSSEYHQALRDHPGCFLA